MIEHSILFSGPMIRAVLCRAKTQTRRVVRWPAWADEDARLHLAMQRPAIGIADYTDGRPIRRMICPYLVGRILWVRETWRRSPEDSMADGIQYRADGLLRWFDRTVDPETLTAMKRLPRDGRWRPSIFMPRQASRLTLRVEDVRTERLWAITEDDARAEGFGPADFCSGWDALNGRRAPWSSNPWVFVVTFAIAEVER